MSEFAPALFVFLVLIFFPFLNLFGYLCGIATAALIANQCATAAAVSQTYDDAINNCSDTAMALSGSCLGKFANLQAVGGYKGTGVDVFVAVTNMGSNTTSVFGPNQPISGTVDTTNNIYEYEAQVNYNVGPFISMAGIPLVSEIPMLGKPAQFTFSVQKAAEYPNGLTGGGPPNSGGGGTNGGGNGSPTVPGGTTAVQ
ncbi:MAG: hypothetical protein C5B53_11010 [Candidatus Melainabacteria bacterium]|nr:MAG: hypothetical protein C5B53_11010 [Candidatus Melainabacteria bacterium]